MICVAYPTVMDGLVLRWWLSMEAYSAHEREVASASRNRAIIEPECTLDICKLADQAHSYLHEQYGGSLHPRLDVARWVTHKHAGGILSRELKPVEVAR